MAYGTVNADVIGTSVANTSLGAGNASIMKNRIINGAMVIDQRNAGASVTPTINELYTLDRWCCRLSQASKYSTQQSSTAPVGFNKSILVTSLSSYSVVSGDYFAYEYRIEGYNIADLGWGTANAKTVTLSFWVRSSLTGNFGGCIINGSPYDWSYPFSYSISAANTWEQKSITIPGSTSGTWNSTNGIGLSIFFGLGVGSTYSGTANTWANALYLAPTGATSVVGTNGATFYITGCQLEVGSSATGYEYRQYGQELALCQRYYCTNLQASGLCANTLSVQLWGSFPVTMRTSASMSVNGTGLLVVTDSVANYTQSSPNLGGNLGTNNGYFLANPSNFTGLTTYRPVTVNYSVNGNALCASAEL